MRSAQNFARCIALCEGDVIVLTDQDDLWFPNRISQTEAAFREQAALTFAFSECPLIDQQGTELGRTIYSSLPIPPGDRRLLLEGTSLLPVLMRWGVLYGTTMAVRASLRQYFLPIPPLWSHDEWIGVVLSAIGPSARLRNPVTRYRQHSGQQVGTGDWTLNTHLGLAQKHSADHYALESNASSRRLPPLWLATFSVSSSRLSFARSLTSCKIVARSNLEGERN